MSFQPIFVQPPPEFTPWFTEPEPDIVADTVNDILTALDDIRVDSARLVLSLERAKKEDKRGIVNYDAAIKQAYQIREQLDGLGLELKEIG